MSLPTHRRPNGLLGRRSILRFCRTGNVDGRPLRGSVHPLAEAQRWQESGARSRGTNAFVYLAGLRIPDEDVRELVRLVDEPTRSFLEKALAQETGVVALTVADRERILWALDDARTDALAELRGVLLQEHEWRDSEGLV